MTTLDALQDQDLKASPPAMKISPTVRQALVKLHFVASAQFGIDPLRFFRGMASLPAYFKDLIAFSSMAKKHNIPVALTPALHDRRDNAGSLSEYFWQDITAAQLINAAAPERHVDVGSLITGFVAYLASHRDIEILDIRPLTLEIPRVTFTQADILTPPAHLLNSLQSLSCLHTIEHFGLGRYGDPLSADGPFVGIERLCSLVAPGGALYLSTPMGRQRVEFNANWVLDPQGVIDAAARCGMKVQRLYRIGPTEAVEADDVENEILNIKRSNYTLVLLVLQKAEKLD